MDKVYNHRKYESNIYQLWESSSAFTPTIDKNKKPFTIIMPPPNANDPLHVGHARFIAIEDILIRYHRMLGRPTLWLPGSDHAGIETQFVFEKHLKEEGKSRFDFNRDKLYQMIWDYVQKNTGIMEKQLKILGASCDWTRFKFTLDPEIVKIVYKTFKKLHDDGLIYRGERVVNYCPRCGTSFSQLEVNYIEKDDFLYFINYGLLSIATTRPETIFADVAIAVNPKDKRYTHLIGKTATIPIINREIPIIKDSLVDPNFGSGALKVTPGHDPVDFEIGQKHKLPVLSIIDETGKMINTPPKYIGLSVSSAREEVVKDLKEKGVLIKIEKIHHTVGTCYRDKGNLEPTVSKQWFLNVNPLVKMTLNAIKEKSVVFASKKYEKIAIHWLKNLKDWNISRQIVWGIRIPAWRCEKCLEWTVTDGKTPKICSLCGHTKLKQDEDTFDTWFSSGQWPYATLLSNSKNSPISDRSKTNSKTLSKINIDYPVSEDFKYFYPTSLMETGYDILPFWVIRMIMLGLYITNNVPFKTVLLHGLVRDAKGEKISKSKGNVIDPIEMAEKYGADSLRMSLVWGALIENDISLSEDNIRGQRNFSNKIWNLGRFIKNKFEQTQCEFLNLKEINRHIKNEDKEIIKETKNLVKKTGNLIEKYRLNEAAQSLYEFIWRKFADKYTESIKKRLENGDKFVLSVYLNLYITYLKLLHPFMPFVTEAIWQEIKHLIKEKYESMLINSPWPSNFFNSN